jgi:hypothetical protein
MVSHFFKVSVPASSTTSWLVPWLRLRELPTTSIRNVSAARAARFGYVKGLLPAKSASVIVAGAEYQFTPMAIVSKCHIGNRGAILGRLLRVASRVRRQDLRPQVVHLKKSATWRPWPLHDGKSVVPHLLLNILSSHRSCTAGD